MAAVTSMIIAGATVVGAGMTAYGSMQASKASKEQAGLSRQIAAQEMKAEEVRMRAMETDAQRKKIEIIRNQQRARSLALATATAQNAQFGSGVQGGFGQISGESGFNYIGVNTALGFGRELFDINRTISGYRMQMADAQSRMSTAQGISSLGGAILNSAGSLGRLGGNFIPAFGAGANGGGGGGMSYGQTISMMGRGARY